MTQQSALLLIPFLGGLVVAAVLLRAATRNILPKSAIASSALAILMSVVYFASSQGRFVLGSKGFLNTMPEGLWFGLTFGVFAGGFFRFLGLFYGDAKRPPMPSRGCGICGLFIPNLIGVILYFLFRRPL